MAQAIYQLYFYIGILGFLYVPLTCGLAVMRKLKYKKFFRNLPLALLFFGQAVLYTGVHIYSGSEAAKSNPSAVVFLVTAGALSFFYVLVQMIELLLYKRSLKEQQESPRIRL